MCPSFFVGEDIGLPIETDLQNFRSMISHYIALEKQEVERSKRCCQKDTQNEDQIVGSTVDSSIHRQMQRNDLDQNQRLHSVVATSTFSNDIPCDENCRSVFSLPLELQEYVRRIQREQQILRHSRTTNKT